MSRLLRTLPILLALVVVHVVVVAGPLRAAEPASAPPDTLRLTLAETLVRARAAAPRLRELQALAEAAGADARAARAARLPSLDLRGGYARWSDVPELTLALPGQPPRVLFENLPDNWTSRASLSLPLWTGGRVEAAVAAARAQAIAAARDADAGASALEFETVAAYWDLAVARERERVLTAAIAAYDAHAVDARNRRRFGMAAGNEVLAVEVERDRAEMARLRASGDAALAAADLARLLDLPAEPVVIAADSLASPPPALADEALEPLVAAALAARPERASLVARGAAAGAAVGAARAARLPQVGLSAGYDYSDPNRRRVPPRAGFEDSWDVGVGVALSVFDGGRAGAETAAARARAQAARERLADFDRRLRLEVTARRIDLQTARASAAVADRAVAAGGESRRVAADRWREGVIASSELLDAETALLRAGLDRAEARARACLAAAALDRAIGRPSAAAAGR